jgi:hypothetical protein
MTTSLLEQIRSDGLTLTMTDGGGLTYRGAPEAVTNWLPCLKAHKAEIMEALKMEPLFTDWRIHFDQSEKEIIIPDGATQAEVEALYPAAVKVEPIQRPPSRPATEAERAELWRLINKVLADAPEEVGEAFTAALADVDGALTCYRTLVA